MKNLGLLSRRMVLCPAVYEVRCSALERVAAGLTNFACLRKPLKLFEWSFDGLTKIVPRQATNFHSHSSFSHAIR